MGEPNWRNRTLFHGDNLGFLRGMNSESVHLIATDPPFNKNRDFHATPDSLASGASFQDRWSWERDVHQDWVDQLKDDFPKLMEAIESARYAHSDGMGAYMCFMAVRLLEMRRVLREDGSIYLHCDPTASHYLKAVMDAIFGWKNFRNEIVWHYQSGGRQKRLFSKKHDNILFYTKSSAWFFDPDAVGVLRGSQRRNNMKRGEDPDGRGYWSIKSAGKVYKYYDDEKMTPFDVWTDITHMQQKDPQRVGYPTQKPIALYERIIKASSNERCVVLDPFCGCATTLVAAERLRRQWVGIDIWNEAHETMIKRLKGEGLSGPDGDTGGNLIVEGQVTYSREIPERTDDGNEAVPFLATVTRKRKLLYRWERLSRHEIMEHLLEAQRVREELVGCAGCGRELEAEFMELDHIRPRAAGGPNDITNRILLCRPCNGRKRAQLTLRGLVDENRKSGWMRDKDKAVFAQKRAVDKAEQIRVELR